MERATVLDPGVARRLPSSVAPATDAVGGGALFWGSKRAFDLAAALFLLPLLIATCAVLWVLNPLWNPGSLFFVHTRMGRDCRPFPMVKFRSMRPLHAVVRCHDDPVEADRITPLGYWLRRTRLDELPQIVNVLLGQMSLIGPRPDVWEHARVYVDVVPGYRERHAVRPGISGLAQVRMGYAEGVADTIRKTRKDRVYIKCASWLMELGIIARTLRIVVTGAGAR